MPLLERCLRGSRPAAEETIEPAVGHRQSLAVLEIVHVEPEAAVGLHVDQARADQLLVDRPAIGGQPHQLVLAAVDLEAAVVGEGRVEQAERVGELDVIEQADAVPLANADRRRAPLAHPVEGDDRRLVEGAGEERAGGMAFMVVGEDQPCPGRPTDSLPQGPPHVQLLLEPDRHGQPEAPKPARRVRQIGLDQPLELGQRLVVERDVVEVQGIQAPLFQAVGDRLPRHRGIVLLPREPLLLRRGHDPAVDDQRGGAVVVEGRDSEDGGHESRLLPAVVRWTFSAGCTARCPRTPSRESMPEIAMRPFARSTCQRQRPSSKLAGLVEVRLRTEVPGAPVAPCRFKTCA